MPEWRRFMTFLRLISTNSVRNKNYKYSEETCKKGTKDRKWPEFPEDVNISQRQTSSQRWDNQEKGQLTDEMPSAIPALLSAILEIVHQDRGRRGIRKGLGHTQETAPTLAPSAEQGPRRGNQSIICFYFPRTFFTNVPVPDETVQKTKNKTRYCIRKISYTFSAKTLYRFKRNWLHSTPPWPKEIVLWFWFSSNKIWATLTA